MQHIWLVAGWIIFGGSHTLLASGTVKEKVRRYMKNHFKFYRLYYSVTAAILLAGVLYLNFTVHTILLWQPPLFEKYFSLVAGATGLVVMSFCIRKYFFELSGISVFFSRPSVTYLETGGLNKYVRHPLYSGTLLFVWSFFFWQPLFSWFISAVSITLYTLIGIHFEERKLVKTFGDAYKKYATGKPMLIPKFF